MSKTLDRCPWPEGDLYIAYHDTEWGVPLHDDRALFEFLILEGAQAGLSWHTVLKKRENYRAAFDQFEPEKVARYTPAKIKKLLANPGLIRNRLKIDSAVRNARAFLAVQEEFGSFDRYLWRFVEGRPIINRFSSMQRSSRPHLGFRRHEQRSKTAGFQFRRFDHLLRPHASHRHGQRPLGALLSPPRTQWLSRYVQRDANLVSREGRGKTYGDAVESKRWRDRRGTVA